MALLVVTVILSFFMLIPTFFFWVSWTYYGIGQTYFSFLPSQFHVIPFWDCFFLLSAIAIVGSLASGGLSRVVQHNKD